MMMNEKKSIGQIEQGGKYISLCGCHQESSIIDSQKHWQQQLTKLLINEHITPTGCNLGFLPLLWLH